MHCHKAQISACGCQTAIGVDLFVSPTRKRNTSRANRRFVSSFGSVVSEVLVLQCDVRVGYIRPRFCFRLEERGHCAELCM